MQSLSVYESIVHCVIKPAINLWMSVRLYFFFQIFLKPFGGTQCIKTFLCGSFTTLVKFIVVDSQTKGVWFFYLFWFRICFAEFVVLHNISQTHHISISINIFINLHMLSFYYLLLFFNLIKNHSMSVLMKMLLIMVINVLFMLTNILFEFLFHFT